MVLYEKKSDTCVVFLHPGSKKAQQSGKSIICTPERLARLMTISEERLSFDIGAIHGLDSCCPFMMS
jgi:hypothetical protein